MVVTCSSLFVLDVGRRMTLSHRHGITMPRRELVLVIGSAQ